MEKELALVILLSNPALDAIALKRIEHILKTSIDWYVVFRISLKERTSFLLCKNLLQYHYFWMVPDSLGLFWWTAYIGNIKRNEEILYHFNLIKKEFSKRKIAAIPSSGVMLLNEIYQNMPGVRQLHDIDFFTEARHLPSIEKTMDKLGFKKIYINDKDLLMNLPNINTSDVLYSKYIDSFYINCDFCCCLKEHTELYSYLWAFMQDSENKDYYCAQLLMLYLAVDNTWDEQYYSHGIKHYIFSRLLDLHLYKNTHNDLELTYFINRLPNNFHINAIIQGVDYTLNFLKKEGYLL